MMAIAARLLGEARLARAFPTNPTAWTEFRTRIVAELADDEHIVVNDEERTDLPRDHVLVVIGDPQPAAVQLSCRYGRGWAYGRLGIDGILDEVGYGWGVSFDDPEQRVELTPPEQEVIRAAGKRSQGSGKRREGRAEFHGAEFVRALAAPPQRDAVVKILAIEQYDDGLGVRFTYDDPVETSSSLPLDLYAMAGVDPPIDEMLAEARREGGNPPPNVSVSDDLGTEYAPAGSSRGGLQVADGVTFFTPAIPDAAARLVVSTYAGAVEFDI